MTLTVYLHHPVPVLSNAVTLRYKESSALLIYERSLAPYDRLISVKNGYKLKGRWTLKNARGVRALVYGTGIGRSRSRKNNFIFTVSFWISNELQFENSR